ncbi:MAG TPA: type II toxin-antitoxin system RelE/ParE family toxin [Gemmataceae bacterium]|nr:type II toxin-antitoxin system RelE/ParE family toxin [Gemmataceae bacterium]
MSLPLWFRPQVALEVNAIRAHYDQQQPDLGDDFFDEYEQCLDRIENSPHLYAKVRGPVRAGPIHRFPYVVYYEAHSDHIVILTVVHGRRSPGTWLGRI